MPHKKTYQRWGVMRKDFIHLGGKRPEILKILTAGLDVTLCVGYLLPPVRI
jgi:hypothetical protein